MTRIMTSICAMKHWSRNLFLPNAFSCNWMEIVIIITMAKTVKWIWRSIKFNNNSWYKAVLKRHMIYCMSSAVHTTCGHIKWWQCYVTIGISAMSSKTTLWSSTNSSVDSTPVFAIRLILSLSILTIWFMVNNKY